MKIEFTNSNPIVYLLCRFVYNYDLPYFCDTDFFISKYVIDRRWLEYI